MPCSTLILACPTTIITQKPVIFNTIATAAAKYDDTAGLLTHRRPCTACTREFSGGQVRKALENWFNAPREGPVKHGLGRALNRRHTDRSHCWNEARQGRGGVEKVAVLPSKGGLKAGIPHLCNDLAELTINAVCHAGKRSQVSCLYCIGKPAYEAGTWCHSTATPATSLKRNCEQVIQLDEPCVLEFCCQSGTE